MMNTHRSTRSKVSEKPRADNHSPFSAVPTLESLRTEM